jgi:hypothetical protein
MEEALRFFRLYETIIYIGLGALAIWEIRKFILAWNDLRGAAFGLEREAAQSRLNRAAIYLTLLLFMAMVEFTLVYFIAPTVPGATPILTPTLDLLATPTHTLSPSGQNEGDPQATPAVTAVPTAAGVGCVTGELEFTNPMQGESVSGEISVSGTVNMTNLAFYTLEVARPGDTVWLTIQAGRGTKVDEPLGTWFTNTLSVGEYVLRLVATNNEGAELATCEILIYVNPIQE